MADEDIKPATDNQEPAATAVAEPEVAAPAEAGDVKPTPKRKKAKRSVPAGQVHVLATFNNTIISFTDNKGGVLTTSSAGACGFRGSKKGTAYAAQVAAEKAGQLAKQSYGLSKVDVFVNGIGLGRDAAIRTLGGLNIQVESIKDVTGVPHGGVRPRKARRV
jgi:small subunit ribosomal protein S11